MVDSDECLQNCLLLWEIGVTKADAGQSLHYFIMSFLCLPACLPLPSSVILHVQTFRTGVYCCISIVQYPVTLPNKAIYGVKTEIYVNKVQYYLCKSGLYGEYYLII